MNTGLAAYWQCNATNLDALFRFNNHFARQDLARKVHRLILLAQYNLQKIDLNHFYIWELLENTKIILWVVCFIFFRNNLFVHQMPFQSKNSQCLKNYMIFNVDIWKKSRTIYWFLQKTKNSLKTDTVTRNMWKFHFKLYLSNVIKYNSYHCIFLS